MKIVTSFAIAFLAFTITSVPSAWSQSDDDLDVDIVIKAKKPATVVLQEYLELDDYVADEHTALAVEAAGAMYQQNNYREADRLLRETLKRGRQSDDWKPENSAVILEAQSQVAAVRGDSDREFKLLKRARRELRYADAPHPAATARLNIRLAGAYARQSLIKTRSNLGLQAVKLLKRVERDKTMPLDFRILAGIHLSRWQLNAGRRNRYIAEANLKAYVEQAKTHSGINPAVKALAASLLATHYRYLGQEDAARQYEADAHAATALIEKPLLVRSNGAGALTGAFPASTFNQATINAAIFRSIAPILPAHSPSRFHSPISGNYADVSYCVSQSGQAHGVQIIGSRGSKHWVDKVVTFVESQEFTSGHRDEDGTSCFPQLERFTIVADKRSITGSRIPTPADQPQIVRADLRDNPLRHTLQHIASE